MGHSLMASNRFHSYFAMPMEHFFMANNLYHILSILWILFGRNECCVSFIVVPGWVKCSGPYGMCKTGACLLFCFVFYLPFCWNAFVYLFLLFMKSIYNMIVCLIFDTLHYCLLRLSSFHMLVFTVMDDSFHSMWMNFCVTCQIISHICWLNTSTNGAYSFWIMYSAVCVKSENCSLIKAVLS